MMIELLGWIGSGLVVASLLQRDLRRLRRVNLAASIVLCVFNVALGMTSMVVLNVVLATVNIVHLRRHRSVAAATADATEPYVPAEFGPTTLTSSKSDIDRYREATGSQRATPARV